MRDTERGRDIGRDKQAPCREPDVGLNPGTPGSCPGLKLVLNICPILLYFIYNYTVYILFFKDFIFIYS